MTMSVRVVDGEPEGSFPRKEKSLVERLLGPPGKYKLLSGQKGPKRLSERTMISLLSRACNISEVKALLDLTKEYTAYWTADQHIVYSEEFGWVEMLQYRPGLLAAAVLHAQKLVDEPLSPSFGKAAAYALGWPMRKVIGFQMGISNKLYENPSGPTDENYLNGVALGYLFYESRAAQKNRGEDVTERK